MFLGQAGIGREVEQRPKGTGLVAAMLIYILGPAVSPSLPHPLLISKIAGAKPRKPRESRGFLQGKGMKVPLL